jgi:hypothetical protein
MGFIKLDSIPVGHFYMPSFVNEDTMQHLSACDVMMSTYCAKGHHQHYDAACPRCWEGQTVRRANGRHDADAGPIKLLPKQSLPLPHSWQRLMILDSYFRSGDLARLDGFHLKTETESSLRNVVLF